MTKALVDADKFIERLKDLEGLCGHCGYRPCADGLAIGQVAMPEKVRMDRVLQALSDARRGVVASAIVSKAQPKKAVKRASR